MTPSVKFTALLLCVGHASANYFGGIGVGPFMDSQDSAYCPPGTKVEQDSAFCCPTGTQEDKAQDADLICCPTAADCTNDLLNSGLQCADPSMTLYKHISSLLCCPAGYFPNDLRYCVNSGPHVLYTVTAQSASLTYDGSTPSSAPSASGSSVASNSAETTTASATTAPTGSGTVGTATTAGGVTTSVGIAGSTTSTGVSTSSSHAAGTSLDGGAGIIGALVAVGGMLLV